jgi:Methylamine utilisation protein MauE.
LFNRFVSNKFLGLGFRLVLGGLLLAVSIGTLSKIGTIATSVSSLNILPDNISHVCGTALPWVEFVVVYCLILGLLTRIAAGLSIVMVINFISANAISIARGIGTGCGHCTGQVPVLSHPVALVINVLMLIMAVQLVLHKERWLSVDSWLSSLLGGKEFNLSKNQDKKP